MNNAIKTCTMVVDWTTDADGYQDKEITCNNAATHRVRGAVELLCPEHVAEWEAEGGLDSLEEL